MIRILFWFFFLLLSCGSFIACSEDTDERDADFAEGGPTVRLVNHGIERGREEDVVFSVSYSLKIDEPLDHRLFLLVNTEMYMKNDEGNGIFQDAWMDMYIIEKGHTNSKYIIGFIVDGVTRVVLQLLPAKDRLDPDNFDTVTSATFPPNEVRTSQKVIRVPSDYKFNPYQLGSPNQLVFNVTEALSKPKED